MRFAEGAAFNGGGEQSEGAWSQLLITWQQRACLVRAPPACGDHGLLTLPLSGAPY